MFFVVIFVYLLVLFLFLAEPSWGAYLLFSCHLGLPWSVLCLCISQSLDGLCGTVAASLFLSNINYHP